MSEHEVERITGKKMGVYVNGKLRLQTRDYEKAVSAAQRWIAEREDVWLTPIGSFTTV